MRTTLMGLALAAAVALVPATAEARSKSRCPSNPVKASHAVWPKYSLKSNHWETGRHPCGRTLTCKGGQRDRGIPRKCRWR
ncbi:MAG: hypothetical protein AB7E70_10000 [Hyphomicrobiaceae bacterium]